MKLSLVILAGLTISVLLRRRTAADRHWILAWAIVGAAALPLLEAALPVWSLPFGAPAAFERRAAAADNPASSQTAPARAQMNSTSAPRKPAAPGPAAPFDWEQVVAWLPTIWIGGAALGLFVLMAGLAHLRSIASRASVVTEGRPAELLSEIARSFALTRPIALLQSDHPSLLVTWGIAHPTILLPASAPEWPESRMRVVLTHELAHIARGDWLSQIVSESLKCLYWFNPLVWIACSRLRLESEHACDDEVLRLGMSGPEYASHLVEVARLLTRQRQIWVAAPSLARKSSLERRVRAMLNNDLNRRPLAGRRRNLLAASAVVCAAVVASAQNAFLTVSGSVSDPQGQRIPGVTLSLSSTTREAKYEVKSNQAGAYEFIGIPAGDYVFEVRGLGFRIVNEPMTLSGTRAQRDFTLEIGTLQETVTVALRPGDSPPAPKLPKEVPMPEPPACTPAPEGGRIIPPKKVRDLAPVYPASGAEGVVSIEATIGTDGFLKDIRVTNVADQDLAAAAVVAVREWRFTQTLLNCSPVEVVMTITTKFEHRH